MLKAIVVEDKEDIARDREGEKNMCDGTRSGTEKVTTATINMR